MLALSSASMAAAQSDDKQPAPATAADAKPADTAAASPASPAADAPTPVPLPDVRGVPAKRHAKHARAPARHHDAVAKSTDTDDAAAIAAAPPATADSGVTTVPQSPPPQAAAEAPSPPSVFGALRDLFTSHAAPQPATASAGTPDAQALAYPAPDAPPAWPQADAKGERLAGDDARRAGRMRDLVVKHAAENGVPFGLADAIIRIESRYTPGIVHAGNYGLMQLRAETARGMGFSGSPSALLDPDVNLRFGMKYLGQAYKLGHGDTCLTVMRYQSGFGATRLSAANRAYCARARSMMASSS